MTPDKRKDGFPILITLAAISYGTIYSVYAYLRYASFNSYVFDLGVSSQLLYGVTHGSGLSFANLVPNKLIYIPMGFIYGIHPYPPSLEYFQSFWLALGSLPLYYIVKKRTGERGASAAIAFSYLIFYPLGGVYWFDFHFMALFPTFILLSFYFRETGRLKSAFVSGLLAAITDFMAPLVLIFYGLFIIIENRHSQTDKKSENYLGIAFVAAGIGIFSLVVAYYGYAYFLSYASGSITVPAPFSLNSTISYRIHFFFWLFLPVLFLIFLAPEALLLMLPYAAFALVNQYTPYVSTMYYQYPALTAPLLFYALALGLQRIKSINVRKLRKITAKISGIAYAVLAVNIALALLFTPAGNGFLNVSMPSGLEYGLTGQHGGYYTDNLIQVHSYDTNISQIISLIPQGSRVLIQNNMAQMTSRYNWTLPDLMNNSSENLPEYVLADPYNRAFYTTYFTSNYHDNMAYYVSNFITGGDYGIYASEDGIVLLKKGFGLDPVRYSPADLNLFSSILPKPSGSIVWSRPGLVYNSNAFIPGGNSSLIITVTGNAVYNFHPLLVSIGWRYSEYSHGHYFNFTAPSQTLSNGNSTEFIYNLTAPGGPVPIFSYDIGYVQETSSVTDISVSVLQTTP